MKSNKTKCCQRLYVIERPVDYLIVSCYKCGRIISKTKTFPGKHGRDLEKVIKKLQLNKKEYIVYRCAYLFLKDEDKKMRIGKLLSTFYGFDVFVVATDLIKLKEVRYDSCSADNIRFRISSFCPVTM